MSHTHLLELYDYIGNRVTETSLIGRDASLSDTARNEAAGAESFLVDAMAFLSESYHGKLPKRLRIKHSSGDFLQLLG